MEWVDVQYVSEVPNTTIRCHYSLWIWKHENLVQKLVIKEPESRNQVDNLGQDSRPLSLLLSRSVS